MDNDSYGGINSSIDSIVLNSAENVETGREQLYKTLIDNLPGFVYRVMCRENYRLVFFDDSVTTITGYKPEEFAKGQICSMEPFIHPDDREKVVKLLKKAQKERSTFELEYRFHHKDDSIRYFSETGIPVYDLDGILLSIDGIIRDITDQKNNELELQASRNNMQSIFRAAPIGIGVVKNQAFLEVNEKLCNLTGYSNEELIGQNVKILYPSKEDYDYAGRESYQQILNYGTGSVKTRWMQKNGQVIDVLLSSSPRDAKDLSRGITFTALDITNSVPVEKSLEFNENYYRTLIYSLREDIIVIDHNYIIKDINNAALQTLRIERTEAIDKPCYEILHGLSSPCDKNGIECGFKYVFETGNHCNLQHNHLTKDGNIINVDLILSPIKDINGNITHVIEAVRDVTDLLNAQKKLRDSEELLRSMAENYPNSYIFIIEKDYTVSFTSGKAFENHNLDPIQFIGLTTDQIFGKQSKLVNKNYGKAFNGEECAFQLNFQDQYQLYNCVPLRNEDNEIHRLLVVVENITERKRAKEKLRFAKDFAENLLETANALIVTLDTRANIITFNKYSEILTGYRKEEVIGKNWFKTFIPPEEINSITDTFIEVLDNQSNTSSFENIIVTKNGEKRLIGWRNNLLLDKEKAIKGVLSIGIDITEQKMVEDALKISEERFRKLFTSIADAAFVIDQETGRILDVNNTAETLYGYSREEWLCMKNEDVSAEPEVTRQATRNLPHFVPVQYHKKKNGTVFPVELLMNSLLIDGKRVIIATGRDVTERREAEEALLKSEKKFRNVIEQSNDAIYILYKDRLELINKSFTDLTGITVSDLKKPDFDFKDIVASESRELIKEREQKRESGLEPASIFSFKLIDQSGIKKLVQASISTISYKDDTAILGFLRDMTEFKNLEEKLLQAQKIESIGLLAGGIAHDFNNLLTPIMGNSELALMNLDPSEPVYNDLKEIAETASRAKDLTRQLLAFGRKQVFEMKIIQLNSLIENFRKILNRAVREDIEIEIIYGSGLGVIEIDVSQIEQVLMNLTINAQDAMPDGGTISIKTEAAELYEEFTEKQVGLSPGFYNLLSVSDTGIGMEASIRDNIFEPFFTTKEVDKGTGLGLSTVYGIIKQHGGNICVKSEPDSGSTFIIYLPTSKKDVEAADAIVSSNLKYCGDETILVVEDDEKVRKIAERIVRTHGYNTYSIANGEEAIQLVVSGKVDIDLLLTDVIMPKINGRELYGFLSGVVPNLKVLYMSGYAHDVIAHHGVLDEGIDFIQKPLDVTMLLSKVRAILDR